VVSKYSDLSKNRVPVNPMLSHHFPDAITILGCFYIFLYTVTYMPHIAPLSDTKSKKILSRWF
jgi:hypothetical protein